MDRRHLFAISDVHVLLESRCLKRLAGTIADALQFAIAGQMEVSESEGM
jgi:hypothetical protein